MRKRITGLAVAFAAVVVSGCSASEPVPDSDTGAPVVHPGAPGDEPRVAEGGAGEGGQQDERSIEAETEYLRMMIPHHQQALEMTALVPDRAEHPQVRALAERIGGVQGPEIEMMRAWLSNHGAAEQTEHDHGKMPGMATPEELARLENSRGAEFDRLFLRLMTAHHEGALTMATDVLTQGTDEQVHEMAQDVRATQSDEIATMQRLLAELR